MMGARRGSFSKGEEREIKYKKKKKRREADDNTAKSGEAEDRTTGVIMSLLHPKLHKK